MNNLKVPFPSSPRVVYRKNPLQEVTCELRFPSILEIPEERPAAFQKQIRKSLPLFKEQRTRTRVQIPNELPPQMLQLILDEAKKENSKRYEFSDTENKVILSLAEDRLIFQSRTYQSWDGFESQLRMVEEAFSSIYEPAFYSRTGIRYVNVIDRQELSLEKSEWQDLLRTRLIGILGGIDGVGIETTRGESVLDLRLDNITGAKAHVRHGLFSKPNSDYQVYVVDTDFYTTERSDSADVLRTLKRFSGEAGNFFRHITRQTLHDALLAD